MNLNSCPLILARFNEIIKIIFLEKIVVMIYLFKHTLSTPQVCADQMLPKLKNLAFPFSRWSQLLFISLDFWNLLATLC